MARMVVAGMIVTRMVMLGVLMIMPAAGRVIVRGMVMPRMVMI